MNRTKAVQTSMTHCLILKKQYLVDIRGIYGSKESLLFVELLS